MCSAVLYVVLVYFHFGHTHEYEWNNDVEVNKRTQNKNIHKQIQHKQTKNSFFQNKNGDACMCLGVCGAASIQPHH